MPTALIVDDEPSIRLLMSRITERLGYTPTEAGNGADAESIVLETNPDFVLLDIMMPAQDGYQTCIHMRENGYRGIIIMFSALAPQQAVPLCKACGADDFIQKPVALEILKKRITALVTERD
jgi:DNA-binding response OmpR family regulator